MAGFEDNRVKRPIIDANNVYEGGRFSEIKVSEIVGNETAVKQLINQYNDRTKMAEKLQMDINDLRAELQYQNTAPFFAIISLVVNTIGAILVGMGGGVISSSGLIGVIMIVLGGICIITANIQTIFHKHINKWYNSKSTKTNQIEIYTEKGLIGL